MGTEIVIVIVGTGLNLALWGMLHRKVDRLPGSFWKLVQRDRAADQKHALDVLQECAAEKVGSIVNSLREHEEHVAAGFRAQVAEAQIHARIVERQSSEAGVALSTAVGLVRELRKLVDGDGEGALAAARPAPTVTEGRATIVIEPEAIDTTRKADRPEPASRERPSPRAGLSSGIAPAPVREGEGERLSEDEMTQVAARPLPGVPNAGKTVASQRGKGT